MSDEFQNWACARLDKIGLTDASVIIQYLEPLEDPKEVRNYLSSMLDMNNHQHSNFVKEFIKKQADSKVDKRFYRKEDIDDQSNKGKKKNKSKPASNVNETKNKKKENSVDKENNKDRESQRRSPVNVDTGANNNNNKKKNNNKETISRQVTPPLPTSGIIGGAKKKTKYVNLYQNDQDTVMLSGRNKCECLASKHKLVNNCISCGRIVCEQEGAGPCMFCDSMVLTKDDEKAGVVVPQKPTYNKPTKLNKNASVKDVAADIERAVSHKDKLLEYDKTSEKRTRVLDDESDYFDSNSRWHSKENREILQAKEKELKEKKYDRSQNKVTIDFLGRTILVDETNDAGVYDPDDPVVKAILEHQPDDIFSASERNSEHAFDISRRPIYIETNGKNKKNLAVELPLKFQMGRDGNSMNRLQDREIQEMADQGKCLSMHQPWASLLVAGIKKHEGRVWYSSHRGRLWIASAAKVPTPEEVRAVEDQYSAANVDAPEFPQHYPPGCLLGHVDVMDVLPQEEYRTLYPDGESESPYVFVCDNPREMVFKFPVRGEHKIFKLESKIHQAARKALK